MSFNSSRGTCARLTGLSGKAKVKKRMSMSSSSSLEELSELSSYSIIWKRSFSSLLLGVIAYTLIIQPYCKDLPCILLRSPLDRLPFLLSCLTTLNFSKQERAHVGNLNAHIATNRKRVAAVTGYMLAVIKL